MRQERSKENGEKEGGGKEGRKVREGRSGAECDEKKIRKGGKPHDGQADGDSPLANKDRTWVFERRKSGSQEVGRRD